MGSDREDSPDWLRCFQAPTHSTLTLSLSSDSDSLPNAGPSRDDKIDSQFPEKHNNHDTDDVDSGAQSRSKKVSKAKASKNGAKVDDITPKKKKRNGNEDDRQVAGEEASKNHIEPHAANYSVLTLSSDSESVPDNNPIKETKKGQIKDSGKDEDAVVGNSGGTPLKEASKKKSPKKGLKVEGHTLKKEKSINDNVQIKGDHNDVEAAEEGTSGKHIGPCVSTSRFPLVLSEKVQRSKALVECEGDSIDLSGDVGAVGRIVIPDAPSGSNEMYLDLKGTIYRTTIVPSRTFCIVSFGQSEAKIEAIMNDFIQLKPQSNVYEAETMVEGTLEGFSFDSEDEADMKPKAISHQTNQKEGTEEQTKGKAKRKAEKSSGVMQKKVKTAGGKLRPAKNVKKKTQVSKRAKTKK